MDNSTAFAIQSVTTIEPSNSTGFNFTTAFFENVTDFINYTTEYITDSFSTNANNDENSKDNASIYISVAATIVASVSLGFGMYNCYKNHQNRRAREHDVELNGVARF